MANASPRRPSLTIATAGHVDHGKTLLTRNLTGVDTDTLAEEKSRGLSINLGFAYSRYRADELECLLGFVDVPGHIDFIGNMLAGVGAVDAALLVVAADDGVMPQTREHAAILDLLEIRSGCVALTKIDRASKTRQHKVRAEVRELLASHGFGEPPVFLIDNGSGAGIEKLRNFLHRLLLAKHRRSANAASDRCRFLIDRAFSVRGIGTVVTGSCLAGRVTTGASLIHDRLGIASRVRGIRTHEHDQQELVAGERAALNIALETDQISRGDWLLDPALHHLTSRFDAKLRLLPGIAEPQPNVRHHLHVGASHRLASLRRLGASEYFQIRTSFPVHVLHGDRFILRDPAASHTLGGGSVIDVFVPARGRASPARLESLAAMDGETGTAARKLAECLAAGLDLDEFSVCRNLGAERVAELIEKLQQAPSPCLALRVAGSEYPRLLGAAHCQGYRRAILAAFADYHRAHPEQAGAAAGQLPRTPGLPSSPPLLQAIIDSLLAEGALLRHGSRLHLPGHGSRLGEQATRLLRELRPVLRRAGKIAPRSRELSQQTGIALPELEKLLRQAQRSGLLVQVADNRHYLPETIRELAELAETLAGGPGGSKRFSVIDFRDASGIGRNLCIEILEHFDRLGFTHRTGNARTIRGKAAKFFAATTSPTHSMLGTSAMAPDPATQPPDT